MPDLRLSVAGVTELRAVMARAKNELLPRELKYANEGAAEVVVDSALPHVPRRSGALVKTLRASGTLRGGFAKAGGLGVPYAAAIHWGRKTGNVGRPPGNHPGVNVIIGRPFLREAALRSRRQIIDEYEQAVRRVIVGIDKGA